MTARKMTTVRLNSQTLATLRELREAHGLSSDAAAIEYLAAVYRENKNGDKKMEIYMHKETGETDTKEGWIASYLAEELEERGLTAAQAFAEDKGNTLFLTK